MKRYIVGMMILALALVGFDAHAQLANTKRVQDHQWILDDIQLQFGSLPDAKCEYDTAQTPDALVCGLPATNDRLILSRFADFGTDFALSDLNSAGITLMSNGGDKSVTIYHDDTNAVIDTSSGTISFADPISTGANALTLENSETVSNGTNGTITFGRNDAGTVTINSKDNDATAALTVAPGGAAAMSIGTTSTTSTTILSDDTGDAEEVHVVNSVGPADVAGLYERLIFCGQADENGTIYLGPATAPFGGDGSASYAISSAGCDALDNATEGTADAPISALATKIHGMRCATAGTLGGGETLAFTLRTATGDAATTDGAATTITCSLAAGETECRTNAGTTTNIAAGATLAVKAVQVSNNADDDLWCSVLVSYP